MSGNPIQGHVRLILLSRNNSTFHLQIPIDVIDTLCLRPRKYLIFLGWCILGVEGHLSLEDHGDAIATDGPLENQIYYYVADVGGKFLSFVAVLPTDNVLLSV